MTETTEDSTSIALVRTDEEIESCFSVMRELRTQLVQSQFVQSVRRLEKGGFRLAFLKENGLGRGRRWLPRDRESRQRPIYVRRRFGNDIGGTLKKLRAATVRLAA